jgi:short-subunit dehydrogenase
MNAIITGAYGAIGTQVAKQLYQRGYTLWLLGRDAINLNDLRTEIKGEGINIYAIDLSRKSEIDRFLLYSACLGMEIHLLINNAATAPKTRLEAQGTEMQWAVNVLSYARMISGLADRMPKGSMIINVASCYAGGLDIRRSYDNRTAYRQSKQAVRMMTAALAKKYPDLKINSVHPGGVKSKVSEDLELGANDTAEYASRSIVNLIDTDVTGKYFEYKEMVDCPFCVDKKIDELMQLIDVEK